MCQIYFECRECGEMVASHGWSTLRVYLDTGNAAMVRHLLKAKAATDAGEDKFGRSPLSVAILENRKDTRQEFFATAHVFRTFLHFLELWTWYEHVNTWEITRNNTTWRWQLNPDKKRWDKKIKVRIECSIKSDTNIFMCILCKKGMDKYDQQTSQFFLLMLRLVC